MNSHISRLKHIAKARTTDDMGGIGTQFLAQTSDVDIHRSVGHHYPNPYMIHQLLTREYLATVHQQQVEKRILSRRQTHRSAVDGRRLLVEIQLQTAKGEQMLTQTSLNDIGSHNHRNGLCQREQSC